MSAKANRERKLSIYLGFALLSGFVTAMGPAFMGKYFAVYLLSGAGLISAMGVLYYFNNRAKLVVYSLILNASLLIGLVLTHALLYASGYL